MSIPTTQRAVQILETGGPEVLRINPAAPVPAPKPNELLVKNTYAGVNYIDTVSPPRSASQHPLNPHS